MSRVGLAVPLERTVIVASRCHEIHLAPESPTPRAPRLVIRPGHRGTAADVLFAAHWIRRRDPGATLAVFPSEQIVLEPLAFMQHVIMLTRFVERHDREIVLVGARPQHPDTQYEWIETGQPIPDSGHDPVWRVSSLRGRLSYSLARACYESGWLWSTSVTVARAETLIRAGQRRCPELAVGLETALALVGTRYEQRSLEACYAVARGASFSEAVLAGAPLLSASCLPSVHWSGRALDEPDLALPEPHGRFDGLVEQRSREANVDSCRTRSSVRADSPWRTKPLDENPWKPPRMSMTEPDPHRMSMSA